MVLVSLYLWGSTGCVKLAPLSVPCALSVTGNDPAVNAAGTLGECHRGRVDDVERAGGVGAQARQLEWIAVPQHEIRTLAGFD